MTRLSYRTIWISDVHLGARDAKVEFLLDFLNHVDTEYLYLVGDIFDIWKLKSGWHWSDINNRIVRRVMQMARSSTRVTYIPGNHDELFRQYTGSEFDGIRIEDDAIHRLKDGRRVLVLHGDEFDAIIKYNKWLAHLGSGAYELLLRLNHWFTYIHHRKLGFRYWSLSAYLKHKVKNAMKYIAKFEEIVAAEALRRGVDGMICGHIHHATIDDRHREVLYANTGDWVESCTALVENQAGELSILRWAEESAFLIDSLESYEDRDRNRGVAPAN